MGVEDPLHRDGEQRPLGGHDPVRLAAAEPDPAAVVKVAEVAHAVPEAAVRVGDLGQSGRLGAVEVGAAHLRPAHGDLADLAGGKRAGRHSMRRSARR